MGLVFILSSPAKACLISHKNKANGIKSQSKNCLLNSKYSLVQGKKNKGNRKIVAFINIDITLSILYKNFSGININYNDKW